jgi:hypothetical protein
MSYQAVQDFYRRLAASPDLVERYNALTHTFFLGYRPKKIVAFAAMTGHHFSVEELDVVRLTNRVRGRSTSLLQSCDDEVDYEPTEYPHTPDSFTEFRKRHGREVGELPREKIPKKRDPGSDALGGHNQR